MIQIDIRADIAEASRSLDAIQLRQLPYATVLALTRTAQIGQIALTQEIGQRFDRPTPWIKNSVFIKPATKIKPQSSFGIKDFTSSKSRYSPMQILEPHFYGGGRVLKTSEQRLRMAGLLDGNEWIVPGAGARLDQYGNISRGQIQQIFSQLKLGMLGSSSNATNSRRSRRNQARAGRIFWSWGPNGKKIPVVDAATGITYGHRGGAASHLAKGAWVEQNGNVKPVLLAVREPHYTSRFNVEKIRADTYAQFGHQLTDAIAYALETAK